MGNGTGERVGTGGRLALPRDELEALLKAGLAAGVSKIDAIVPRAGVLLTLLRGGRTGLREQHWFKMGVSRWFCTDRTLDELSCQLLPSLPSAVLSSMLDILLLLDIAHVVVLVVVVVVVELLFAPVVITRSERLWPFCSFRSSSELLFVTVINGKLIRFFLLC